jgi:zinc/manganese transport system ATP-binding protein
MKTLRRHPGDAASAAPEPTAAEGAPDVSEARQVLEVSRLSVRLSGRYVLRDVSFGLGAGELAGLIGSNGAGKTTLIKAILGLQPTAGGNVARGSVGYVPQKVVLDPDLPVRARDLVALGIDGHRLGVGFQSAAKRAQVERLLAAAGALHLADARVGALSGGEQQRVLIAHALASRPELLLLDEPLANLDPASTQATVSLLSRLARSGGVGVLVSTHDINPVLPVMDRVVYLAGGRAASGPTAEVVKSDVLSALYGHHVDVLRAHGRVIVSVADEHREQGCESPEEADALMHALAPARSPLPQAQGCELVPEDHGSVAQP